MKWYISNNSITVYDLDRIKEKFPALYEEAEKKADMFFGNVGIGDYKDILLAMDMFIKGYLSSIIVGFKE